MATVTGTQFNDGGLLPWPFDGILTPPLIGRDDEADFIFGFSGDDVLIGLGGNDLLDGGFDMDDMAGGSGNDTYVVDSVGDFVDETSDHLFLADGSLANDPGDTVYSYIDFTLPFNVENLNLYEGSAARNGIGNELGNVINGNSDSNTLLGLDGNDELHGGDGNDNLFGNRDDDVLYGDAHNDELFGSDGDDQLYGGSHGDTLSGGADDDLLDGGTGGDTMRGETGNDDYYVDNAADQTIEDLDQGIDEVFSSISFTLGANFEHLTLQAGAGAIDGTGNELNNDITGNDSVNTLIGNDGFDTLDGRGGADILRGGRGGDTYFVDNIGDEVEEFANEGLDTVFSSVNFSLDATAVEDLTLQDGALNGFGNSLDNTLTGNDADNELYGYFGEDTLKGGGGADELYGGTQNDILKGGGGADQLRGEAGDDQMRGDSGNDSYFVDSLGDVVFENGPAEDIDSVSTTIDLTLPVNVERLFLQLPALNGTGNDLNNLIVGNALNNTINGGAGTDTLIGGIGDDTYFVDNLDDVVTEAAGQGTVDTVKTSVSYRLTLGSEVEQLAAADALGTAALNLTGNEFRNTIRGNDGANVIDGGGNADVMIGRKGNDTYMVNNVNDRVTELANEGVDKVISSVNVVALAANVENVSLSGILNISANGNGLDNIMEGNDGRNTLDGGDGADEIHGFGENDVLFGGAKDDQLFGDGGADTLIGSLGADKLTGGSGADIFEFRSQEDSGFKGAAADEILDFSAKEGDTIDLSKIDANSLVADDQAFTFIGNNNPFSGQAGELRFNAGQLEGDLNGDLNADFRIQVNVASLVEANFIL